MEASDEDDIYIIKIPVGASRGYNIFTINKSVWDEIFSFYEGEDIIYDLEDEEGEVVPINLSYMCEIAEIVAINPSDEIEEFVDQIEDKTMFNILCNACSGSDKFNKELEYNISSALQNIGIYNNTVNAIGYGKNRLKTTINNRQLHITLYEDRIGVPQRTMIIDIIDTKTREKPLSTTIVGEDLNYNKMIEYITSIQSLMQQSSVKYEKEDIVMNNNSSVTIAELTDGVVKAQTEDIHTKLMQKLAVE